MSKLGAVVRVGEAAASKMRSVLAANPALVTKIGTALKRPGMSIENIVAAVKANPLTAALVIMEMGDAANEIASLVSEVDPEVGQHLVNMGFSVDPIPADGLISFADLARYQDDVAAIDSVARDVGGIAALVRLRTVLAMSDAHFDMYFQVKELARAIR